MPIHLIFLFIFQSGLAFAFSYFIARIIVNSSQEDARDGILAGICLVRKIVLGFCVILPPLMFLAYFKSLPEGKSTSLAVWPAAWILMILLAVVLALTLAMRKPAEAKHLHD